MFLCHFSLAISECVSMYCIRTLACFIYFDRNKNRKCRIRRRKLAKKSAKKMNEQNKCVNKNSGLILKYSEHISFCSCYLHCCSNTKKTHTQPHCDFFKKLFLFLFAPLFLSNSTPFFLSNR